MRPTTSGAASLMRSDDPSEWARYRGLYDEAVSAVSIQKKLNSSQLARCDKWVRIQFPSEMRSCVERSLNKAQLEQFMQWKLWRGKDRPMLMSLIRQNSESRISEISRLSFGLSEEGRYREAMVQMTELKGVGPATASAILAACYPDNFVFMADEVIEASTGKKREYTMKAYDATVKSITRKQKILGDAWSAEEVGRALWTAGILSQVATTSTLVSSSGSNQQNASEAFSMTGKKRKR